MVSNSTNIGPDCLNDDPDHRNNVNGTGDKGTIHTAAPPLKVNMNLNKTTTTSIRRPLQTDDSDVDFQPVTNKKSQRKQRKSKENPVSQVITANLISSDTDPAQNRTFGGPDVHIDRTNDETGRLSQQISISKESARYAQTRYPFPPFVIRFISGKVTFNQVKICLIDHCEKIYQTNIQILNCRASTAVQGINHYDFLVYVKDVLSFSFLLEQTHWPSLIGNESFSFPSTPSIPPQLCLLIKNVDLNIDFNDFCYELKAKFPEVKNIIRMKNKFQNDIKMIKLELISSTVRDKLLNDKKIGINYITYDVSEYLAPATVLICSKCMAIGHFKKQCTQVKDTCRTCGELVDEIKNHNCSKIENCIHCKQNHKSSSLKCPIIKSFRAELTRKILHSNHVPVHGANSTNKGYAFNSSYFPHLPAPKSPSSSLLNNPMLSKLDELINKLSEVKNQLTNLETKHDQFEKFMLLKNQNDDILKSDLLILSNNQDNLKKDIVQHSVFINRHENMFNKLFIPMLDDICLFISTQNIGNKGKILDADLNCKLERYRLQMKKAQDGKHFTN